MHKSQCYVSTAGNPCFQVILLLNQGFHVLVETKLRDQVSHKVTKVQVKCQSYKDSFQERILKGQLHKSCLS